jgi:hypothetical protein
MNNRVAEEQMLKTDYLALAIAANDNVVVSISGKKMFFPLELLVSMKDRNIDTTADNLYFYCHKLGEEVEGADEARINLVSRELTKEQAFAC